MRQKLAELRVMAEQERADMLCYLIEMAYIEAGEMMTPDPNPGSPAVGKRYGPV